LPDDVSKKLADSGRVPSYKSIAMCLLKNDLKLLGIGYEAKTNDEMYRAIKSMNDKQGKLL
jgi:predicted phosphoadenosine phosphosulfate sulfurtransferase